MDNGHKQSFSKRHGFRSENIEITVREDAPARFREALIAIAYDIGEFRPSDLRKIICTVLRCRPNMDNWTEYPNIDYEVHCLITDCAWYRVYEVAESIYVYLHMPKKAAFFENELNEVFFEHGSDGRWKTALS